MATPTSGAATTIARRSCGRRARVIQRSAATDPAASTTGAIPSL